MSKPANLNDVQGDSVVGFIKKAEAFYFFEIKADRVNDFRKQLGRLLPDISSASKVLRDRKAVEDSKAAGSTKLLKISGLNIAFSQQGLKLLGVTDKTGDQVFEAGMRADAKNLGDTGKSQGGGFDPAWDPAFKGNRIHGLISAAGDSAKTVNEVISKVEATFRFGKPEATINQIKRIDGKVRPGEEEGHEHFGFLDDISQPRIKDIPGQFFPDGESGPIGQGIILVGREADEKQASRPSWAVDGSFLAFRFLRQLVPEFSRFLEANALPGTRNTKGSDLLGARLVGRWKSGTPIDLSPTADNPGLAQDPAKRNNFHYTIESDQTDQTRCPFGAHVRKTNPRGDLDTFGGTAKRRILRRGIPFGEELTQQEIDSGRTQLKRGLCFVAYQSDIANGFQFIQKSWSNTPNFPPKPPTKPSQTSGIDPIGGQVGGGPRTLVGTNPKDQKKQLTLPVEWVISDGGEYFFSPSIPALKNKFALNGSSSPQPPDVGKLSLSGGGSPQASMRPPQRSSARAPARGPAQTGGRTTGRQAGRQAGPGTQHRQGGALAPGRLGTRGFAPI